MHDRAQDETDRRSLEKLERSIKRIFSAIKARMYQPAMKAFGANPAQDLASFAVQAGVDLTSLSSGREHDVLDDRRT